MADLLKLRALADVAMTRATDAYLAGGRVSVWERDMRAIIARAHTAAHLAGVAERLGISASSPLLAPNKLSRAERADIRRGVEAQLRFFERFVADVKAGRLTPAQTLARARLYAGPTRQSFTASRWGDWDIPADLMPGNQACMANCLCEISNIRDNGDGTGILTRRMGGTERHCTECPKLAGDHVVKRKAA